MTRQRFRPYLSMALLGNFAVAILAGEVAAAVDLPSLAKDYFWGTPKESTTAASQLMALPFDEVQPVLAAVVQPETFDYLNAIQLYSQFDDPATIPVLVDFLIAYSETPWMRREPYRFFALELRESAINAIAYYGFNAARPYLEGATTQHDYYWDAVAQIYSKTGGERAMLSLFELVRDGDEYTARSAAAGLVRNEAVWLIPELELAYKTAPRRSSRHRILDVLRNLWGADFPKEKEFHLVTSEPIADWYDVTRLSHEGFEGRLTDFQRAFIENIEQIPEYGYARADYQCNSLSMPDYVSTENDKSVWNQEQQAWVNKNRAIIIDELMRPYRMSGAHIEEGFDNLFYLYPSNAQVLAYLGAEEALPWLRNSFVYANGNHYTGEGAYPFSYFQGQPFPYHDVLRGAIEHLTGKPLSEAIELTPPELDFLIEDRQTANPSETWLYKLYCLQPARASEELFRLFHESGPEHNLNLAITVVQVLRGSELSPHEIVERLGPPGFISGSCWYYSIARYYQTGQWKVANTLRLTFSGDRLMDMALLLKKEDGTYEEWNSYYLSTDK